MVLWAPYSQAKDMEIDLQNEALRLDIGTGGLKAMNGSLANMGIFYTEDGDYLAHFGLGVIGDNWTKKGTFRVTLGGRLYLLSLDEETVALDKELTSATIKVDSSLAVAFGGRVRFTPSNRFGVGMHFFYAPDITAFSSLDSLVEAEFRMDYQLIPQAFIYTGYRYIGLDFSSDTGVDGDDFEFDSEVNVGFRFLF